jgi:hypothetical protein
MRFKTVMCVAAAAVIWFRPSPNADESNKLTYLTFSKSVQLPGVMLPAGKYRFELADPDDSRQVIKVQTEDGKKQLAMLMSIPHQLSRPTKDPLVLFAETPAREPDAVKAFVYPGESIGYEFIYPRNEAMKIAKRHHTSVLSSSGEKVDRVDENGNTAPEQAK